MIRIIAAGPEHLDQVSPLFDAYRVFYKQAPDPEGARNFLNERITGKESVVFLAYWENKAAGFVQLFPSFSSVSMQPLFILNDLFVGHKYRGQGIATALLAHCKAYNDQCGYKGLALETATDNPAQELYERLGWKKDEACFHYFWTSPKA